MKMYVSAGSHPEWVGLITLAENHARAFEFDRALELYDQALDLLPDEGAPIAQADQEAALRLARASLRVQLGQWRQAQEDLDRVASQAASVSDTSQIVRAHLLNAEIDSFHGDFSEAIHKLEKALQIARAEPCTATDRASTHLLLGTLYARIGEHEQGMAMLCTAADDLAGLESIDEAPAVRAGILLQQGLDAFRRRRVDDARALYEKSLEISRRHLPDSCAEADAYRYLGVLDTLQGEHLKALRWHRKALRIYKLTRNPLGQAKVFNSIGQACLQVPRRDEALFFLRKARQICRQLGADAEMAHIYGKLGMVYLERDELDRAIEFQLKDVELCRRFGNYRALAFATRNLGLSYRAKGESEEAAHYLTESLQRFTELQDPVQIARLHLDLARNLLDQGDTYQAEIAVEKACEILVAPDGSPDLGVAHLLLGSIHHRNRQLVEAEHDYNRALRILDEHPSAALAEANFGLGQLYYEMRSHGRATEHLKQTLRLCRSLNLRRLLERTVPYLERIDDIELVNLLVEDVEQEG